MKLKPERRAARVLAAFQRGKRDAEAKRGMMVPYSDREQQEAYERGYRWVLRQRHGAPA